MALAGERLPEVYSFHPGVVAGTVLAAVFLQVVLPHYLPLPTVVSLIELPLLVVVYFGFARRNPASGLLLGLAVGVLQDALSYLPIGTYGMAKTAVGYAASSLNNRLDTEPAHARLLLLFGFYFFHQFVYAGVQRTLLGQAAEFVGLPVLEGALVNALLGVVAFHGLDRFRRST